MRLFWLIKIILLTTLMVVVLIPFYLVVLPPLTSTRLPKKQTFATSKNGSNQRHSSSTSPKKSSSTSNNRYHVNDHHVDVNTALDALTLLSFSDNRTSTSKRYSNSKWNQLEKQLQQSSTRYYIYDDPMLTLPEIRLRAQNGNFTWPHKWGTHFQSWSQWEILYLESFEKTTTKGRRVMDWTIADVIVIPIPFGAAWTASTEPKQLIRQTMDYLYHQEAFQSVPDKHVLMTFIEPMFEESKKALMEQLTGLNQYDYDKLINTTIATHMDCRRWDNALSKNIPQQWYWGLNKKKTYSVNRRGFSISLMGAATDISLGEVRTILSKDEFSKQKPYNVFYHTTEGTSVNNSTQFRHAPIAVADQYKPPSSVGYDLEAEEWINRFRRAKFCLVIRGDKPYSRSLFRSLRVGCIPLIVNDMADLYAPIFRSFLKLQDYAIQVSEYEFLHNPAESINLAIDRVMSNETKLLELLEGIKFVQRLIIPNHSTQSSLFVEAFLYETIASRNESYYTISDEDVSSFIPLASIK